MKLATIYIPTTLPSVFAKQHTFVYEVKVKGKGKSVPLQARRGPEASRKLRFPDHVTMAQDGGRLSALRTGRLSPRK